MDHANPNQRLLWHGIDKNIDEIKLSHKTNQARKMILASVAEQGFGAETVQRRVDTNDYGDVIIKLSALKGEGSLPIKVFEKDRGTSFCGWFQMRWRSCRRQSCSSARTAPSISSMPPLSLEGRGGGCAVDAGAIL